MRVSAKSDYALRALIEIAARENEDWRMARDPDEVSVADVIRAIDGPLVSVYGLRPEAVAYNDTAEALQHVWIAARSSLREVFEEVTIRSLTTKRLPEKVAARTRDEEAWRPH
jgi:DNA-binding IscR family transcriptional regulator